MGHQFFPDWIRPRLIALILLMFQGTQAVGSLLWGALTDSLGLQTTLMIAAALLAASAVSLRLVGLGAETGIEPVLPVDVGRVSAGVGPALTPADGATFETGPGDGPVEVRYLYRVDDDRRAEFLSAIKDLRRSRLRLGGSAWRMETAPGRAGEYVESYRVAGPAAFAEQERVRLTVPEAALRGRVRDCVVDVSGPEFRSLDRT